MVTPLPPGVRELQVQPGQRARRKKPREQQPGIAVQHHEISQPPLQGPRPDQLAVRSPRLDHHQINLRMARGVVEGERPPAGADLQLERRVTPEIPLPVGIELVRLGAPEHHAGRE